MSKYANTRAPISKTAIGKVAEILGIKEGLNANQKLSKIATMSQKTVRQALKRAGIAGFALNEAIDFVLDYKTPRAGSKTPRGADPKGLMKPKAKKVEQPKKKPNVPPKAPPPKPKSIKKKTEDKKNKTIQLYMKEKNTGKDSNVKFNSRGGMLKKGKK
jgi:hypothetical protein